MGSFSVWSVCPYEDLPCYICAAHCSDPAHTRDQSRGGHTEVEVDEVYQVHWKLHQQRAVPLCKCGRRSFLYAHSTLLLHVRWTKRLHTNTQYLVSIICDLELIYCIVISLSEQIHSMEMLKSCDSSPVLSGMAGSSFMRPTCTIWSEETSDTTSLHTSTCSTSLQVFICSAVYSFLEWHLSSKYNLLLC